MKNLQIFKVEGSNKEPYVYLDSHGTIIITGKSYMENPTNFYEPIEEWIIEYTKNLAKKTILVFYINQFNTSTIRSISEILKCFNELFKKKQNIKGFWLYEEDDEDTYESGEDLKNYFEPLQLIKVEEYELPLELLKIWAKSIEDGKRNDTIIKNLK